MVLSGQQGGANYGGVSFDPRLGYVFVNVRNVADMGRMNPATQLPVSRRLGLS